MMLSEDPLPGPLLIRYMGGNQSAFCGTSISPASSCPLSRMSARREQTRRVQCQSNCLAAVIPRRLLADGPSLISVPTDL